MEHSQANIDALRSDHEEADSRMFVYVSHAKELYSTGGVVIWNISINIQRWCASISPSSEKHVIDESYSSS